MIITKLIGGLGNQMFQYAAGLSLASKHNTSLKLDVNFLLDRSKRYYRHTHREYALDIFNISGGVATDNEIRAHVVPRKGNKYVYHLLMKLNRQNGVYSESDLNSIDDFFQIPSSAYIQGSWQDVEYIEGVELALRHEFSFREPLPKSHDYIYGEIKRHEAVCVVFRRGDYVGHPTLDIVGHDFYHKAIEIIANKVKDPCFFVFSDDIEWCKQNFKPENGKVVFVDQEYTGPKAQYYLMLMSECKHHIIPNSTYPWWGAWLCQNPGKLVVAPKIWYKGQSCDRSKILMKDWISL